MVKMPVTRNSKYPDTIGTFKAVYIHKQYAVIYQVLVSFPHTMIRSAFHSLEWSGSESWKQRACAWLVTIVFTISPK